MFCGTFTVPLNHSDPAGDTIDLAVIKFPARVQPALGSLFVNPGGPGGSGVEAVQWDGEKDAARYGDRHDLIGFDPRGVGKSAPVRCFPIAGQEQVFLDVFRTYGVSLEQLAAKAQVLGELCAKHAARILPFVTTAAVARDLELMRIALGSDDLNFIGYSYGTHIGLTYLNMFPDTTGRIILDGVQDPVAYMAGYGFGFTPNTTEAVDDMHVEENVEMFASSCEEAGPGRCALADPSAERPYVLARLMQKMVDLDAQPLPVSGSEVPGILTGASLTGLVRQLVYRPKDWPKYATALAELLADNGVPARNLAAPRGGLGESEYTSGMSAVACSDGPAPTYDASSFRREFDLMSDLYPISKYSFLSINLICAFWPRSDAAERYTGPWNRATKSRILVVSNVHDPVTPIESAEQVHRTLADSHLVRIDGITESPRIALELELALLQEERRTKELELAILHLQIQDRNQLLHQNLSHSSSHHAHGCQSPTHNDSDVQQPNEPLKMQPLAIPLVNPNEVVAHETTVFGGTHHGGQGDWDMDSWLDLQPAAYPPDSIESLASILSPFDSFWDSPELQMLVGLDGAVSSEQRTCYEKHPDTSDASSGTLPYLSPEAPLHHVDAGSQPQGLPSASNASSESSSLPPSTSETTHRTVPHSRRRPVASVSVECRSCGKHFLHLILHGTREQLATVHTYILDFACTRCAVHLGNKKQRGGGGKTMSGNHPGFRRDTRIPCDVCKRHAGAGGVRMAPASLTTWTDPPFAVEHICQSCNDKYTLCSECGGGGRFRTGKWRPRQLFAENRMTCSLPHFRYASLSWQATVWRLPRRHELTGADPYPLMEDSLQEAPVLVQEACARAVSDSLLDTLAIAKEMESHPPLSTWEQVEAASQEWANATREIVGGTASKWRPAKHTDTDPAYIRSYLGIRAVARSGTPAAEVLKDPVHLAKVVSFAALEWHVRHGVVLNVKCIGRNTRKQSGREMTGEALIAIMKDFESMAEYARTHGTPCPPRPKWWRINLLQPSDPRSRDHQEQAAKKVGVRPLEKAPETGWTIDEFADRLSGDKLKTRCWVGDIDSLVAACIRYKDVDLPAPGKKRVLED
ncbi:hypothetical protein HKX48_004700 [Thoreauomyces humboldtii]|nr:hypothetical protein HKX48_004700 [Thoreauomyces humboldtii]